MRLIAKEAEVEHLRSKLASSQDSATDARRTAVDGTGKVTAIAGLWAACVWAIWRAEKVSARFCRIETAASC